MTFLRPFWFAAGAFFMVGAYAQFPGCRVLDEDLQRSYVGGCRSGLADGNGVARGLAEYRGEFSAGRRHGAGTLHTPEGDHYEGQFDNGRLSGLGTYVWNSAGPRSGERYVGNFREGRRDGSGTHAWPGGQSYSGEWRAGQPVGQITEPMVRRARAYAELATALERPGTLACRQILMGISERHWIRGVVVSLSNESLRVRLEQPDSAGLTLHGKALAAGLEIQDDFLAWVPCI